MPFGYTCASRSSYRDVEELLAERGLDVSMRQSGDGFANLAVFCSELAPPKTQAK